MSVFKKLIGGVLLAAIFVSSPLQAGDKDVNVINTPDVIVANEAPIPVEIQNGAQTIVEWRYVGYTEWEDNGIFEYGGLIGIAAMNKACANDFGPGARAATISEALFIDEPVDPATGPTFQWLVPGGPMTVGSGPNGYIAFDAATGTAVSRTETSAGATLAKAFCGQYTQSGERSAPILNFSGGAVRGGCGLNIPAACSAPVAIPVTPLP